jgi:hypothetical protein
MYLIQILFVVGSILNIAIQYIEAVGERVDMLSPLYPLYTLFIPQPLSDGNCSSWEVNFIQGN